MGGVSVEGRGLGVFRFGGKTWPSGGLPFPSGSVQRHFIKSGSFSVTEGGWGPNRGTRSRSHCKSRRNSESAGAPALGALLHRRPGPGEEGWALPRGAGFGQVPWKSLVWRSVSGVPTPGWKTMSQPQMAWVPCEMEPTVLRAPLPAPLAPTPPPRAVSQPEPPADDGGAEGQAQATPPLAHAPSRSAPLP